jgi:hypothetical protein
MTCMAYPASCNFTRHTAALARGYRLYQKAVSGTISPVGENWRRVARDKTGDRPFSTKALWLNDNSHPSRLGSYLAAATILRTITSTKISAADYTAGLPPESAQYLRTMVDKP